MNAWNRHRGAEGTGPIPADIHELHRSTLWSPLLRRLTHEVPSWLVIKNAQAALDGVGDVDSMAATADWPIIEAIFRTWVRDEGLTELGICRHLWRGPNLVARDPSSPYLLVLDVKALRTFRGSPLITAADALALAVMDDAGFRRMRPGAEGVVKLLHNGTTRRGRPDRGGLARKGVVALLRADPVGADLAAAWVGLAAPALRRAIAAVVNGGWSQRDMTVVQAWCLARGLAHPGNPARQVRLRVTGERCPFVHITRHDHRRLPADSEAWVTAMRLAHPEPIALTTSGGVST